MAGGGGRDGTGPSTASVVLQRSLATARLPCPSASCASRPAHRPGRSTRPAGRVRARSFGRWRSALPLPTLRPCCATPSGPLWAEPPAAARARRRVWRDWVLLARCWWPGVLEATLRDDLVWPSGSPRARCRAGVRACRGGAPTRVARVAVLVRRDDRSPRWRRSSPAPATPVGLYSAAFVLLLCTRWPGGASGRDVADRAGDPRGRRGRARPTSDSPARRARPRGFAVPGARPR